MPDSSNSKPGTPPVPSDEGMGLAVGARLAEFEIRGVLGSGGFGIVYSAWDNALQRDVALKEYMPVSLASRGSGERITLRSRSCEEDFALGLQSFVNEARLLARFDHPALVKVFRFWESNGTAYMAMPLYKGRNLRQLRKELPSDTFDDAWMRALVEPLLGALEAMHEAKVYHRDISPDNILWCDNQQPVLLDFGAARLVLADRTQNVTAILKPQFAPIEQYGETQSMRQGPWTDLYSLASTCYFMLAGRAPLPATGRVMDDELVPLAQIAPAGCSLPLLRALDWAMAVRPQDRPQSVGQLRDAIAGLIPIPPRPETHAHAALPLDEPSAENYEKTIKTAPRSSAPRSTSRADPPVAAPTSARERPVTDLDGAERSVVLPPKSRWPLATIALLAVVVGAAAGAWTTRPQWGPIVAAKFPALAFVAPAPATEPAASAAVPAGADSGVASPASAASDAAGAASAATEASAVAAPASSPAAASAPTVEPASAAASASGPAPTPAPHQKPVAKARAKSSPRGVPGFVLPPPVLPPADDGHTVKPVPVPDHATPAADSSDATSAAAMHVAAAGRAPGPREACKESDPANVNACVKRLCDSDTRYQRYPACQRLLRQEERQGQDATQ